MLYRQAHEENHLHMENRNIVWFSQVKNYGESYGRYLGTYAVKRKLNLLNLGNQKIRDEIKQRHPLMNELLDPDYQYSGSNQNRHVHEQLFNIFQHVCDGTYINTDEVTDEELEGPTEIVLWGNIKNMVCLVEITDLLQ
jgi:hypothetical protein